MTLPSSYPINLLQVKNELFSAAGSNNLDNNYVRLLANVPSGPISLSNLLGKQGSFTGDITFQMGSGGSFGTLNSITPIGNTTFFNATGLRITSNLGNTININVDNTPTWAGDLYFVNNSLSLGYRVPRTASTQWYLDVSPATPIPGSTLGAGGTATQNFTIGPYVF